MTPRRHALALACCLAFIAPRIAAEDATRVLPEFRSAEVIHRPGPPQYPRRELRQGREGWVHVGFIVTAEGVPENVVVEDSNGLRRFEQAAVRWVEGLRYQPATLDGEPVPQAFNGYRIQFDLRNEGEGVSAKVKRSYRRGVRALQDGDLDAARAELDAGFARPSLNLYEEAWLSMLRGMICQAEQDAQCTVEAFDSALRLGRDVLERDVLEQLAQTAFAVQARTGRARAARGTYCLLADATSEERAERALGSALAALEAHVASDAPVEVSGTLERIASSEDPALGLWTFRPARRMPALLSFEGELEGLEIRCDTYQTRIAPTAGRAWRIPEVWGACCLYFLGEPGTRVLLSDMHPNDAGT